MIRQRKKKNMPKNNEKGFTVIEAMVAIVIFSVGVLATVTMQVQSMNSNTRSMNTTDASSIAASTIEGLKPLDYMSDTELTDGVKGLPDKENFSISYQVITDAVIPNTKHIRVSTTWTERGDTKTVAIDYIKADLI
jgi:type IV pilus assembly protein PilV